MSDLVERLEHYAKLAMPHYPNDLCSEAKREIQNLRAALTQFVAACETAPPTSLMTEIGMACKVAKRALALPSDQRGTE